MYSEADHKEDEIMRTRMDGMLSYDDQMMEMAEGILRAEGLRDT